MKQLANVRKAVAGIDDATLTSWIKEPARHSKQHNTGLMPADATRTRFLSRVLPVAAMKNILVSGHSNVKIGRDVRKGKLKGYWIYTLSLEERATCPRSCHHWRSCFGNAMPFGKRVDHMDPSFLPVLEAQIQSLLAIRGRKGVLIRLHALGDFYSVEYVRFWERMLEENSRLSVFGYTARLRSDPIGHAVFWLNAAYGYRCMIRTSNGDGDCMNTVSIEKPEDRPADAFLCPEQTGGTVCCATCAACWSTAKTVAFLNH